MQIEFVEPFDHYPAALDAVTAGSMYSQWVMSSTTGFPWSFVTGLGGDGLAFQINRGVQGMTIRRAFTPSSKISLHFAIRLVDLFVDSRYFPIICVYDNAHAHQWSLAINGIGRFTLWGEGAPAVGGTGTPLATSLEALSVGIVYRVSVSVDLDTSKFSLAINSATPDANMDDITVDLQDQATNQMAEFEIWQASSACHTVQWDDIVLGTGEAIIWGPLEVKLHGPESDVAVQFSRSTGADNYANVDETTFNGDTDYNFSVTTGHKDIFGIVNPAATPEFIVAVSQLTLARKEDSATRNMRNVLRKAGVDYNGVDAAMSESYVHHWTHWVQDPATLADWNPADFAALESGYEYRP